MEDLHFHQEPYNLARDLAGNFLRGDEDLEAYWQIRARNARLANIPVYLPSAETIAAASRPEILQPVNG
jgi:hypothetical protein